MGVLIDTNIWCYYFDSKAPEHQKVSTYLDDLLGRESIVINTVILMEIAHFLVKNIGAVRGKEKIEKFLSYPLIIIDFDYEIALESLEMLYKYNYTGIGGRDSTILATMKKQGIKKLITHDESFKKIEWIEFIDPVEKLKS